MSLTSSFLLILKLWFWPLALLCWSCRAVVEVTRSLWGFWVYWTKEVVDALASCAWNRGLTRPKPQEAGPQDPKTPEAEPDDGSVICEDLFEDFADNHPALAGVGFYESFARTGASEQMSFKTFVEKHPALAGVGRYRVFKAPVLSVLNLSPMDMLKDGITHAEELLEKKIKQARANKQAYKTSVKARRQAEDWLEQEASKGRKTVAENDALQQELKTLNRETARKRRSRRRQRF